MATLVLTKTWVNLANTGEVDFVAAWRADDDPDVRAVTGRVVQYAGGRQRGVTQLGTQSSWTLTLRGVSTADTDKLAAWMGQTVLVRDNRGRRFWGVILAVPRAAWKDDLDRYEVALSLLGVDVVEDV